jgi:hypothetical protein
LVRLEQGLFLRFTSIAQTLHTEATLGLLAGNEIQTLDQHYSKVTACMAAGQMA